MLLAMKLLLAFVIAYSILIVAVGGLEPWVVESLCMNSISITVLVLGLMQERNTRKVIAEFEKETNEMMGKFVKETNEIMGKYER